MNLHVSNVTSHGMKELLAEGHNKQDFHVSCSQMTYANVLIAELELKSKKDVHI